MATVQVAPKNLDLFRRYLSAGKPIALRNKIATQNDGLAKKEARKQSQKCSEPYDDLAQIGRMGLFKAIERFDPDKGIAFSSFAIPYIRGEIQHFLRDRWGVIKIPRRWVETHSHIQRTKRILIQRGKKIPEEKILASEGISPEKWQRITEAIARKPILDIDEVHDAELSEEYHPEEDHTKVHQLLGQLGNPYRTLLAAYCIGDQPLQLVAANLKLSEEEARELLEEAKYWLKAQLEYGRDRYSEH